MKFYQIPFHDNYLINIQGNIFDTIENKEVFPFKKNNKFYVSIDNLIFEVAKLVLNTFIGDFPAKIKYKYTKNQFDTKSIQYDIRIESVNENKLKINNIDFIRLRNYPSYFITSDGIVYSSYYDKFVLKSFNQRGYPTVNLIDINGKRSPRKVHRLVYETFIGELVEGYIIDHKNGKKWCSSYWNLEQITQQENVDRAYINGQNPTGKWTKEIVHKVCQLLESNTDMNTIRNILNIKKNDYNSFKMLVHAILNKKYYRDISSNYDLDNYLSELNKKDRKLDVKDVIEIRNYLKSGLSLKEIAKKYNCTTSTITKIRDNKTWKNIRDEFNE